MTHFSLIYRIASKTSKVMDFEAFDVWHFIHIIICGLISILMIVYPLHIDHDNNHLNIVTLDVIEAHSYILLVFENDTHC